MIFPRISIAIFYAVFASSFLAAAMPWNTEPTSTPPITTTVTVTAPGPTVTSAGQCNTGPVQCCNSVQSASSKSASVLLGLLGIVLSDLNFLVGLTCSPITVIGAAGSSCGAQTVCCQDNSHGGLISIGCVPVTL